MADRAMFDYMKPPHGLPREVNWGWREKAPRGCRNPKLLRVDYYKEYNSITIPIQSREAFYKDALEIAAEASTPEELRRALQARRDRRFAELQELRTKIREQSTSVDSHNTEVGVDEALSNTNLASLLQLIHGLVCGWAEPDRSKRKLAEEERASFLKRLSRDPYFAMPDYSEYEPWVRDGEAQSDDADEPETPSSTSSGARIQECQDKDEEAAEWRFKIHYGWEPHQPEVPDGSSGGWDPEGHLKIRPYKFNTFDDEDAVNKQPPSVDASTSIRSPSRAGEVLSPQQRAPAATPPTPSRQPVSKARVSRAARPAWVARVARVTAPRLARNLLSLFNDPRNLPIIARHGIADYQAVI